MSGDELPAFPDDPVPSSQHGRRLLELIAVMARLRGPGGCPWDAEQTHASLARHLLEEAHELLAAIDMGDRDGIRDELGDVLLQVVFHAQIAADDGAWDVDDVAQGLIDKLVRRHPHVFGDVEVSGAEEVLLNWEQIKATEKETEAHDLEDDIPMSLPALARASKVQRRAAGFGFDWRTPEAAIAKLREEVDELEAATTPEEAESELGDVLFAAAAVARRVGADPESALRRTTTRFAHRYEAMRGRAAAESVDLEALDDDALPAYFRSSRSPHSMEPTTGDAVALERTIEFQRWLNEAAAELVTPTPHGRACSSPSFPRRYDSNFLWVTDVGPDLTAVTLDEEVGRALSGFEHREVMVNDDELGERIAPGFAELGYDGTRLVVLRHWREPDREPVVPVAQASFAEGRPLFEESMRREPYITDDAELHSMVGWRARLEDRVGARFFAGTVDGSQAGACDVYRHGDVAMVEDVFTLEEFQGRGVARAVVTAAVRAAREEGADLVFLHAVAEGRPQQLYAKLGFEPIGHVWSFLRSPVTIER